MSTAAASALLTGPSSFREELRRLTNAYLLYRYLVQRGDINKAPLAIRILYAKIVSCLAGVRHLLEQGYAGPAAMVLRSMFETAVNLQVILKRDTPSRCRLFEEFLYIERYERMASTPVTADVRARNEADFARVRSNYHPKRPHSWCWKVVPSAKTRGAVPDNPSFKELCAHIGHPEYYDEIYDRLSAAIHPVPTYETWLRQSDGHMELGPNFTQHIPMVANLTTTLAVDSLVRVVFGLNLPDAQEFGVFCAAATSSSQAET